MESVGDARAFLSAAREVALHKPVIVLKAGRSEAAARAAAAHAGARAGSDEVLQAAFRRSGVLRVASVSDLFHMADVLGKQPRPRGPRLAVVTNAGGPGVLAADALLAAGGELAQLDLQTVAGLHALLPPPWSPANPVDVLGDAGPDRYARAAEAVARDPGSDGLLVILTPQALADPTQTAERLKPLAQTTGKPVLASWMGGAAVGAGVAILSRAGVPTFAYPDTAARVFAYMWQYTYNLRGLYETPALPAGDEEGGAGRARAGQLLEAVRRAGRTLLTEHESRQLLAAYGIPTVPTALAATEEEAARRADGLGYPAVLKLHSETVPHKADVGGVRLDLADAEAVRRAFRAIEGAVRERAGPGHFLGVTVQPLVRRDGHELVLGSRIDPQFGPVLRFGMGGRLAEVFQDRALALPPLTTTLARRLMEQTRIYAALKGVRGGRPVDLAGLERLLVRFSRLAVEQRWVLEVDINPLLASPDRLLALGARVVLHGPDEREDDLPRPAIRPYPGRYVWPWAGRDGPPCLIRPIRPEDEPLLAAFHETLSEQSVYLRYLQAVKLSQRQAHERLARLCFIDYDRELALVAEGRGPGEGARAVAAVGRLIRQRGTPEEAEFALLVGDRFQGAGLGTEVLRRLLEVARAERIRRVTADILPENGAMQHVCAKLGFRLRHDAAERLMKAAVDL
jgi:acetyltransferase